MHQNKSPNLFQLCALSHHPTVIDCIPHWDFHPLPIDCISIRLFSHLLRRRNSHANEYKQHHISWVISSQWCPEKLAEVGSNCEMSACTVGKFVLVSHALRFVLVVRKESSNCNITPVLMPILGITSTPTTTWQPCGEKKVLRKCASNRLAEDDLQILIVAIFRATFIPPTWSSNDNGIAYFFLCLRFGVGYFAIISSCESLIRVLIIIPCSLNTSASARVLKNKGGL